MNYKLKIKETGEEFDCSKDEVVLEALELNGIEIESDCRVGVCGTCKVKLIEGSVNQEDQNFLSSDEIKDGYILTCSSYPESDCTISIND